MQLMNRTPEEIIRLVDWEMESITDQAIQDALKAVLVFPSCHMRNWDWGKRSESYPCWTVAEDKEFDTGIVYSDFGFGPQNPWGLVFLSDAWFGQDFSWFTNLEDAFCDFSASGPLPIWNVVRKSEEGKNQIVLSDLTFSVAAEKRDELNAALGASIYFVERRKK